VSRMGLAAILALSVGLPAPAAEDAATVQVETTRGSRVKGSLALKSIKVSSDLGNLEIAIDKIESVQRTAEGSFGGGLGGGGNSEPYFAIQTTSGSTITGKIEPDKFQVESDFGPLTIPLDALASLRIVRPQAAESEKPAATKAVKREATKAEKREAKREARKEKRRPGGEKEEAKPGEADPKPSVEPASEPPPLQSPIPRFLTRPAGDRVSRLPAGPVPRPCPPTPVAVRF
jgi:hypothetical protein